MAFGEYEFCDECVFGDGESAVCDECDEGDCFMPEDEDCMRRKPHPALDEQRAFFKLKLKEAA